MASKLWLLGTTVPNLIKTKLPRKLHVFKMFMHHHIILKKTISESVNLVAGELLEIWNSAGIDTKAKRKVVVQIKAIHKNYITLSKNKHRKTTTQQNAERSFCKSLRSLLDISSQFHNNPKEATRFLEDQLGERKLKFTSETKHSPNNFTTFECETIEEYSYNSSDASDDERDSNHEITEYVPYFKQNNSHMEMEMSTILNEALYSSEVSSALDRTNITDNKYTMVAAAIGKACMKKMEKKKTNKTKKKSFKVSRSTVQRRRAANRTITAKNIKQEFKNKLKYGLVVHFDGKKMVDSTNTDSDKRIAKIERVVVAVSEHGEDKLLGAKKISKGTGKLIGDSVNDLLNEWDCDKHVIGMSFDTTSSNTGKFKGACKHLESLMKRNFLYLACRHHILELIIGAVFVILFGSSTGPSVEMFKEFRKKWHTLDKTKFDVLNRSHFQSKLSQQFKNVTIKALQKALDKKTEYLPRDDYKEFCELTLIILGVSIPGYKFKRPGAHHHARWMAKVNYCLKMYMFRKQMGYSEDTNSSLANFCLFVSLIYSRNWIQCPLTADAPSNDLSFYNDLHRYAKINQKISKCALDKFSNHLWYLSEELVPLSLFSDKVSIREKKAIITKMKRCEDINWESRSIRLKNTSDLHKKSLSDLVGPASLPALRSLRLTSLDMILNVDAKNWVSDEFEQATKFVQSIKSVNDVAERSIALTTNFNHSFTQNEDIKQDVLQVVEDHRKRVSKVTKKHLLK